MILDRLAGAAGRRTERQKKIIPPEEMERKALSLNPDTGFPFEKALAAPGMSFICECKKASPSKGIIAPDFPYLEIARGYERAGTECISVLTEPKWFLGDDNYLRQIAETVSVPCIRKDFTVDEYMIYGARALGASAVLLICAILDYGQLRAYLQLSDELGLTALVEAHDENEVQVGVAPKNVVHEGHPKNVVHVAPKNEVHVDHSKNVGHVVNYFYVLNLPYF